MSQLVSTDDRLKTEFKKLNEENTILIKKNAHYEEENKLLTEEINATIQKIDVNNLLKEVDIEDLKMLAQNNQMMNFALGTMIKKWESINKVDD